MDPLVARLKAGDLGAFDEVYAQYHVRLHGFVARLTGRRDLAHDLLQETWIRLATRAADLADDTRLGAWLYTVARNLCASHERWRALDGRRRALLAWGAESPTSPFDLTAAGELERRLEEAVAALPFRYREVLLLVAVEGLSPTEAAGILGLKPEAVRQRLSRARAMVEEELAPRAGSEEQR